MKSVGDDAVEETWIMIANDIAMECGGSCAEKGCGKFRGAQARGASRESEPSSLQRKARRMTVKGSEESAYVQGAPTEVALSTRIS